MQRPPGHMPLAGQWGATTASSGAPSVFSLPHLALPCPTSPCQGTLPTSPQCSFPMCRAGSEEEEELAQELAHIKEHIGQEVNWGWPIGDGHGGSGGGPTCTRRGHSCSPRGGSLGTGHPKPVIIIMPCTGHPKPVVIIMPCTGHPKPRHMALIR